MGPELDRNPGHQAGRTAVTSACRVPHCSPLQGLPTPGPFPPTLSLCLPATPRVFWPQ